LLLLTEAPAILPVFALEAAKIARAVPRAHHAIEEIPGNRGGQRGTNWIEVCLA
jgi:hypothetical protein